MTKFFFCIFIIIAIIGCRKDEIMVAYESINIPNNGSISSISNVKDSVLIAVGGNTWENGFITESVDNGTTWKTTFNAPKQLFSIITADDKIITTGIDGWIFQKKINTKEWQTTRTDVWKILKSIVAKNDTIFAVGGASFGFGLIAGFDKNNKTMLLDTFKNELVCIKYNADHFYSCGYGIVLQSNKDGNSWKQLPIKGDFFKSMDFEGNIGMMIGASGTILKSDDNGNNWSKLDASTDLSFSDQSMNQIRYIDKNTLYIVGNQGLVWKSTTNGKDWKVIVGLPKYDYTDFCKIGNKIFITSNQGKLIAINL